MQASCANKCALRKILTDRGICSPSAWSSLLPATKTVRCFVELELQWKVLSRVKENQMMRNYFLVYFVKLYILRAYLNSSSGGTIVCIQQLELIILFRWPFSWLVWATDSHIKRISINCCIHTVVPPDDGSRYARNMYRLTKYTKNKLCTKLVFLYTVISRCTVNRT